MGARFQRGRADRAEFAAARVVIALQTPSAARLIEAWDVARIQHPIDRALTIAGAWTDLGRDALADLPIGARDALLLRIRGALTSTVLSGTCACGTCGEAAAFELRLDPVPLAGSDPIEVAVAGQRVRMRRPNSHDLAAVAFIADEDAALGALLARCLLDDVALGAEVIAALDAALEAAEGVAAVEIAFDCPVCAAANHAPLDISAHLWTDLERRANCLLDEVDALARAYGWSEGEILGLSDRRRAIYVARSQR